MAGKLIQFPHEGARLRRSLRCHEHYACPCQVMKEQLFNDLWQAAHDAWSDRRRTGRVKAERWDRIHTAMCMLGEFTRWER